MAVFINVLNGGNITIGTGGSGGGGSTGQGETRYKYAGDTEWRTVSISGSIVGTPPMDGPPQPTTQIPNITDIVALEIGTDVTSIGEYAFFFCNSLTSVTIPSSVANIEAEAFAGCTNLTSLTFQGKTLAQVQGMANYSWGISDESIINVA